MLKKRFAHELLERVEMFICEEAICQPGQRVLIACSGGPDSSALLDIMHRLAGKLELSLGVVHVDHGQRPDSKRAMTSVKARCRRVGIPFFCHVLDLQEAPPGSSEAILRSSRFKCFRRTATQHDYQRLALGHTKNDQVETVLMRILRGTGTFGLQGIPTIRDDFFVRPLLCCASGELIDYLNARRLRYFVDVSNQDPSFLRNRIRHELLPLVRNLINPAVDNAILRLANSAVRVHECIDSMAAGIQPVKDLLGGVTLDFTELEPLHDAVLARVLLKAIQLINGPGANLEQYHMDRLLDFIRERKGKKGSMDLPDGIRLSSRGGSIRFGSSNEPLEKSIQILVSGPGDLELPDGRTKLRIRYVNNFNCREASNEHVFFDGEEVRFPVLVRSVAPGDLLRQWGNIGKRKVARLLLDAKVPCRLRTRVPVLVAGDTVLWVAGIRRSDAAPVRSNSRKIISVELFDASWQDPFHRSP